MSKTDYVVGLDIGTTKIAAIVGRQNEYGKLDILGMGKAPSPGVSRGVVTHITPTVEAIKEAVAIAEEKSGEKIHSVNVGIAGQHIRSIQHRHIKTRDSYDDEISKDELRQMRDDMYKLVVQPGEEIIDVIPQDYIIDNERGITNPIGMSGVRVEANYHIIIAQMAAAANITKCVIKAGLEVLDITLEPLASSDAVLSEDEKEVGVVLVDIGGGTTDVAIFHDHIIRHTAVIPFGGNVITNDIKDGCAIIRKQAELLKVRFGSALANENLENEIVVIPGLKGRPPKEISLKNLAHIIEARMTEIIEQVYFEIRNSGFEKKLNAGIVVTGGGSELKHVAQLFEYISGLDTRIGLPTEHLASDNKEIALPTFSTGVGLIVKGYQYIEDQMDDIPEPAMAHASAEAQPNSDGATSETTEVEAEATNEKDEYQEYLDERQKKTGFFSELIRKGQKWLEDE